MLPNLYCIIVFGVTLDCYLLFIRLYRNGCYFQKCCHYLITNTKKCYCVCCSVPAQLVRTGRVGRRPTAARPCGYEQVITAARSRRVSTESSASAYHIPSRPHRLPLHRWLQPSPRHSTALQLSLLTADTRAAQHHVLQR